MEFDSKFKNLRLFVHTENVCINMAYNTDFYSIVFKN